MSEVAPIPKDRKIEYTRPFMYPYQTAILNSLARFTVCLAATKCGKTASHIVWLFEQALLCKANQSVWWLHQHSDKQRLRITVGESADKR